MKIYILPISGGGFVAQLGLLHEIYKSTKTETQLGIRPDLVLASSGGNVCSYLAMMNNWTDTGILRNCHLVDSSVFIQSWTPPFFPTWIVFPLTGSIYRTATGIEKLFKLVFTPKSIATTEIWSGTYNQTKQKAVMFCNKNIETSCIKDDGKDSYIYDQAPSIYLDSNVEEISKSCYASASIPYITPGVIIGKDRYVDGGAAYSSPLIPMMTKVSDAIERNKNKIPLQIYYFCSYDMNTRFSDNVYSNSVGILVHSSLLQDRAAALSLLKQHAKVKDIPSVHTNLNSVALGKIIKSLENKSYLMLLYPKGNPSVSVTNFNGEDVCKIVNSIGGHFSVYIYETESF